MFPTLTDLIEYLFHIHILLPIQTFGFCVAMSFFITYFVFVAELKRKERDRLIHAYIEKEVIGLPASILEIAINGLLGFFFAFKVVGAILDYQLFLSEPLRYLFSPKGNWIAGIISGIGFAAWIYYERKKQQLPKPMVVEQVVHPYQLMLSMAFLLGFWGVIGARLFNTFENLQTLWFDPFGTLFATTGFTYYGGLIFGSITWLYVLNKKGMKLIHLADIGSPGMMLAYGIGRIGCQLSGDGDWGIVNRHAKPNWLSWLPDWMWADRFPHNSLNFGTHIPGCICNHCNQLRFGVYPTSFYEAVLCIGLFALMWAIRKKIKAPGLMFYIYLTLNGTERFFIEMIRVTDKYHIFNVTITQAQGICLLLIAGGITGIVYLIIKRPKPAVN